MALPSATANPGEVYADRLNALQAQERRLERRYVRLSWWRRIVLIALVLLAILVEREGTLTKAILIAIPALILDRLIKRRVRVTQSIWTNQRLAELYERRLACVEERWSGTGEAGTRYLDPEHPAAADLDLFGVGGLFERLVTPNTRAGEDTLAGWLLT